VSVIGHYETLDRLAAAAYNFGRHTANDPMVELSVLDSESIIESQLTDVSAEAVSVYGPEHQTVVAIEELSELQKELCKALRGKANLPAIAEETADVHLILREVELMYCVDEEVKRWLSMKLERLFANISKTVKGRMRNG